METQATEKNGRAGTIGTGSALDNNVSKSELITVCPYRYSGCISQQGYICTIGGPCDPMDDKGRRFAISYTEEHGQRFMARKPVVPV